MSRYFEQIYQSEDFATISEIGSVNHEQLFIDGWFKGVLELWNQVKEKL